MSHCMSTCIRILIHSIAQYISLVLSLISIRLNMHNFERLWIFCSLSLQRHRVRIVPVTQVMYTYKSQQNAFFVYGFEHKVYAPDYPDQCCWGCTLL